MAGEFKDEAGLSFHETSKERLYARSGLRTEISWGLLKIWLARTHTKGEKGCQCVRNLCPKSSVLDS